MRSICARVPKEQGDVFRKKLIEAHLINKKLIIKHNTKYLYIPLQTPPSEQWLEEFQDIELEIVEREFEIYTEQIRDYKKSLNLTPELSKQLPTSYDIIGSIAILKIPESLRGYNHQIGEAIIRTHNNIKTVARDNGVKGNLRVRELEIIAGESKTETLHKEYGIRLNLDVAKVYFSPRLAKEHYRLSQLVQFSEVILDMFSGIGPFSIMIAKYSQAERVYSIDINKFAIEYLIKNIDQNKVTNIFPLEGDIRKLIKKIPKVDRIIMNLPMGAKEYLAEAFAVLKPKGIIHYHEMLSNDELTNQKNWLRTTANRHGFELLSIKEHNLGSYSPTIDHFCFDLTLKKY